MDLDLTGRVALVTAASGGIGRACALGLAAEGMKVALMARNADALSLLEAEINAGPGEAMSIPLSFDAPGYPGDVVKAVLDRWGQIDTLVGNTPGPRYGAAESVTQEEWHGALQMNFLGMVELTTAVLPSMRQRKTGRIFYIGTIGVRTVQHFMSLSNATRMALWGYAKTLSDEVAEDNILVNLIAPGPIESRRQLSFFEVTAKTRGITVEQARDMWVGEVPLKRMGKFQDIVSLVALLSSDVCSFTTGAVIPVDGGKARSY